MTGFIFRRSLYALSLLATLTALSVAAETVTSDWSYTIPTGGSRGTAVDGAGNIYTVGETGSTSYLHSISSAGVNNWSITLGSFNNAKGPSIDLDRDVLYVAVGNGYNGTGYLKAFDLNGSLLWEYNTGGIANNPSIGRDGTIYVGDFTAGNVFAINPDGTLKWTYTLPSNIYQSITGVTVLEDGRVAVPAFASNFPTQTAAVYLLNADGTLAWMHALDGRFVTGIAVDAAGNLIASEDSNGGPSKAYGIDINGNRLWTFATGNNNYGPALAADGSIYIGSYDGNLYALNSNGSHQWTFNAGLALCAPVAGENGTIYVASRTGSGDQLFAVSATGSLLAQAALTPGYIGAWEAVSPSLTDNGKLYVGHAANQLQAFSVSAQGLADSPWPRTYQNNQNTSQVPAVEVSIPDLTSFYAQPLDAPVQIGDIDGQGIVSAELFIAYDGDLLTPFSSPVSSTTMTSAWTIETNVIEGNGTPIDTLKIAMADEVALAGTGDLLTLHFDVADIRVPYTSPLELVHALFNDGTPQAATSDGSVKLIGTTGTTGSTPSVIPREPITISINDIDENTDPATVQQFDITVVNGAQIETLTLLEQGVDTDLFSATINTVFSLASTSTSTGGDGIVQAKAGDEVTFLYDDQLFGNGDGPVQLHQETAVIGGADGSLRVTMVAQAGDTVRVRSTDGDLVGVVVVPVANARTSEAESILLREFTPSGDVFFGRAFTNDQTGVIGDSTLQVARYDSLSATYVDTLTALGSIDTLKVSTYITLFGDCDGNGNLQAFDAARALIYVLLPGSTTIDTLACNVDSLAPIGPITPYDAALILQKRVGLVGRFPVQEPTSVNHPQPETSLQPGPKLIPDARWLSLRPHADYLSVWSEERSSIVSGDVLIAGVNGQVLPGEELGGFLVQSRATDDGLRIVFAGAEAVSGPGELLRLYGVGPEGAQLVRASFNDGRIVAELTSGPLQVMPTAFALHANAPNPFNPETTIAFDLPSDSRVRLEVYDVLGQRVRTLVSSNLSAGSHRVLWDGRNGRGMQVGSGMYFYQLQAGDYIRTRRMLLLK